MHLPQTETRWWLHCNLEMYSHQKMLTATKAAAGSDSWRWHCSWNGFTNILIAAVNMRKEKKRTQTSKKQKQQWIFFNNNNKINTLLTMKPTEGGQLLQHFTIVGISNSPIQSLWHHQKREIIHRSNHRKQISRQWIDYIRNSAKLKSHSSKNQAVHQYTALKKSNFFTLTLALMRSSRTFTAERLVAKLLPAHIALSDSITH